MSRFIQSMGQLTNYNDGEWWAGNSAAPAQTSSVGGGSSAYSQQQNTQKKSYDDALRGYDAQRQEIAARDAQAQVNYQGLLNNVLGGIAGAGATEKQRIADTYAREQGSATQSLMSRGLGNTTVVDSIGRGLVADREKAYTDVAERTANMRAGYLSSIGQAQIGSYQQGSAMLGDLAKQRLTTQAGIYNTQLQGGYGLEDTRLRGEYGLASIAATPRPAGHIATQSTGPMEAMIRGEYGLASQQLAQQGQADGGYGGYTDYGSDGSVSYGGGYGGGY